MLNKLVMRTVAQLKKTIDDNNYRIHYYFDDMTKAEHKRMIKRTESLVDLKRYLETKPKEKFIESEKQRLKKSILVRQSQFEIWHRNILFEQREFSTEKLRRIFCKETGITALRKQLKNLNFLLNENQEHPATR